ncbi:MAG: AAA family ATPase, partial [Patescibacteria group bacterium]|nr:AAA family ATPase [Patescibacteria group bacterium]
VTSVLLGSPPGYVGDDIKPRLADNYIYKSYKDAEQAGTLHPLIKDIENCNIILFDEFEKAHENLSQMLLSVMDEGKIKLNKGDEEEIIDKSKTTSTSNILNPKKSKYGYSEVTNFKNTIIIFTSNLGAKDIQDQLSGKIKTMGFSQGEDKKVIIPRDFYEKEMKEYFAPEFINRMSEFIPFNTLDEKSLRLILELTISKYNKDYDYTNTSIILRKKIKDFLVNKSLESNMGARFLVKKFEKLIITNFNRVLNNGTITQMEKINEEKINGLIFDINKKEEISVRGQFTNLKNDKVVVVEKKKKKRRELYQDEVIVSLQNNSLILTLRDNILPSIVYLKTLYQEKNQFSLNFDDEIIAYEKQLLMWGLTTRDIEILKEATIESKMTDYENFYGHMTGVKLWNKEDFNNNFNGMTRYIEKYMRRFFENNKDIKKLIESDAGTKAEVLGPIYVVARKMVNGRVLTKEEDDIIASIFHREYLRLKSDNKSEKDLKDDDQASKKKSDIESKKEEKTEKSKKGVTDSNGGINININLNGEKTDITSWQEILKNVFGDDFNNIVNSIKKNTVLSDDIIDVLTKTKDDMDFKFNSNQTNALQNAANIIWENKDLYIELEFEIQIMFDDDFEYIKSIINEEYEDQNKLIDYLNSINIKLHN